MAAGKRARRKAISEGKRRFWQEQFKNGPILPDKKRCPQCKEVKNASAFGIRRYKLKSVPIGEKLDSWCKECCARNAKERRDRQIAEGVDVQAREKAWAEKRRAKASPARLAQERERYREASAIYRRRRGAKPRGSYKAPPNRDKDVSTLPILKWLREESGIKLENDPKSKDGGVRLIAERTGVSERRIGSVLREEQAKIRLSTVDKLLVGLDAPHVLLDLYPLE